MGIERVFVKEDEGRFFFFSGLVWVKIWREEDMNMGNEEGERETSYSPALFHFFLYSFLFLSATQWKEL